MSNAHAAAESDSAVNVNIIIIAAEAATFKIVSVDHSTGNLIECAVTGSVSGSAEGPVADSGNDTIVEVGFTGHVDISGNGMISVQTQSGIGTCNHVGTFSIIHIGIVTEIDLAACGIGIIRITGGTVETDRYFVSGGSGCLKPCALCQMSIAVDSDDAAARSVNIGRLNCISGEINIIISSAEYGGVVCCVVHF